MPTPLPSKGMVLQTTEFADSLYSPIKWLVVVEISATLFQPARSGSHLYSAPLHPVRSRTLSARTYSLSWAPTFRGRLASLICVLIISQTLRFVKTFFNFFLGAVGDSNPHFNFSPHLGDTLTCSPVCAGGAI